MRGRADEGGRRTRGVGGRTDGERVRGGEVGGWGEGRKGGSKGREGGIKRGREAREGRVTACLTSSAQTVYIIYLYEFMLTK